MVTDKIFSALISRTPEIVTGNGLKPAAVLIAIQERADGDYIVLTKRGDNMPTHKGQIAFPGGRVHAGDADLVATALRESHEEIGVVPEHVQVLARLDESTPGYGLVLARRPSELSLLCQQWLGYLGRHRAHSGAVSRARL